MLAELSGKNVLLLQGPVGPFFRRFACELEDNGANVVKVNFNAGDALFYAGKPALFFRGSLEDWPEYLEQLLNHRCIDVIFLFGDCRPIHVKAREVAESTGTPVYVFEEGYLRPDYITLEPGGVNGNSSMPKDPDFYLKAGCKPRTDVVPVKGAFTPFAIYSGINAIAHTLAGWTYPKYQHHRELNVFLEGPRWLTGALRKIKYKELEKGITERLEGALSKKYFLVALQVHLDSQIQHSGYEDVEDFISEIVESFAKHAPSDNYLVVKHHPLDRGYRDYTDFLRNLTSFHNLGDRLIYVHDLHLPTLLKNAKGTVLINSTVGLSSLYHGTPVKALGRAVYNIADLTCQCDLSEFWDKPLFFDKTLLSSLLNWMQTSIQPNGNLYTTAAKSKSSTGIHWTHRLPIMHK